MGDTLRYLLDVVGDQHGGGGVGVLADLGQRLDEDLATAQVKARAGLIEQQQFRISHQCAGDLDTLSLALRQSAESAVHQAVHMQGRHQRTGTCVIQLVVLLAPATHHAVGRGDDHVAYRFTWWDPRGDRRGRDTDSRSQLEDVDRPEVLPQQLHHTAGGVHLGAQQLQHGRLASPVRADHHPALALVNSEVHVIKQELLAPPHTDTRQLGHRNHGPDDTRLPNPTQPGSGSEMQDEPDDPDRDRRAGARELDQHA